MKRWIVLACAAAFVLSALVIVADTGWSFADRTGASGERLDEKPLWPEANGVTPTAPPMPSPTPTTVPTPPPR